MYLSMSFIIAYVFRKLFYNKRSKNMTGIILNTTFTNKDLPSDLSFKDQILAIPSFNKWYQADSSHTTATGVSIDSMNDVAGSAVKFESTSANKAELVDSLISGYSGASFGAGATANTMLYSSSFDSSAAWTIFMAIRNNDISVNNQTVLSQFTSASNKLLCQFKDTAVVTMSQGDRGLSVPCYESEWLWVGFSYDGIDKLTVYSSTDTTKQVITATVASNVAGMVLGNLTALQVSQPLLHADVSDIIFFSDNILETQSEKVVEGYFSSVYGIG